jgi:hypothetical protein
VLRKSLASLDTCNIVDNICQVMHLDSNAIITKINLQGCGLSVRLSISITHKNLAG